MPLYLKLTLSALRSVTAATQYRCILLKCTFQVQFAEYSVLPGSFVFAGAAQPEPSLDCRKLEFWAHGPAVCGGSCWQYERLIVGFSFRMLCVKIRNFLLPGVNIETYDSIVKSTVIKQAKGLKVNTSYFGVSLTGLLTKITKLTFCPWWIVCCGAS